LKTPSPSPKALTRKSISKAQKIPEKNNSEENGANDSIAKLQLEDEDDSEEDKDFEIIDQESEDTDNEIEVDSEGENDLSEEEEEGIKKAFVSDEESDDEEDDDEESEISDEAEEEEKENTPFDFSGVEEELQKVEADVHPRPFKDDEEDEYNYDSSDEEVDFALANE
jgi:hypothetical protein